MMKRLVTGIVTLSVVSLMFGGSASATSTDDLSVTPGQNGTFAIPGKPIAITRVGGFGSAEGSVKLIADGPESGEAPMSPWRWASEAIQATVPGTAPGDPPYFVEVTVNGETYTGPIDVRSLPLDGSNYPPTHPPTHCPSC